MENVSVLVSHNILIQVIPHKSCSTHHYILLCYKHHNIMH